MRTMNPVPKDTPLVLRFRLPGCPDAKPTWRSPGGPKVGMGVMFEQVSERPTDGYGRPNSSRWPKMTKWLIDGRS